MATKPTIANAEWATDATFTSGDQSGQNTKLDPGAAWRKQGFVKRMILIPKYLNYWFNQVYQWCLYLSDLHNSSGFLGQAYTFTSTITADSLVSSNDIDATTNIDAGGSITAGVDFRAVGDYKYTAAKTFSVSVPLAGVGTTNWGDGSGALNWYPSTVDGALVCDSTAKKVAVSLKQILRTGYTITRVRAAYEAVGANASMELIKRVVDPTSTSAPAESVEASDTASSTTKIMDTGTISEAVAPLEDWYVVFTSSASVADNIRWLVIDFSTTQVKAG